MKKIVSIISVFFLVVFNANASEVGIKIKYIDHEALRIYNFLDDTYSIRQNQLQDSLFSFFNTFIGPHSIKITQTLSPDQIPYYAYTAKPALPDSNRHALQKLLLSLPAPEAARIPFITEYIVTVNGGYIKRNLRYSPLLEDPKEIRRKSYLADDIETMSNSLYHWVEKGAVPILMQILQEGETRYPTTKVFLDFIANTAKEKYSLEEEIIYWQAFENFDLYPSLYPLLNVLHLIKKGQTEYAQAHLQWIYQNEIQETLVHYLLDETTWRLLDYNNKKDDLQVDQQQLNPLSLDTLNPRLKEEAYQNAIRLETANLFIAPESFDSDFSTFAQTALQLEAYAYAAQAYIMLSKWNQENAEEYLKRYRYALHKITKTPLTSRVEKKQFKRLRKKLRKTMKKHSAYKAFKL